MIYLLSIVFILSILVFVHELGHFLAAKLFGVRVERFSIGFPPRLFGKKIGDTDYCISAIPFGGYVKLSGMIDESLDKEGLTGEPHEFMSKNTFQKVVIISAGVIMNFILAIAILAGILWLKGDKIYPSTTIGPVMENSISKEIGLQKNDKILEINGQPIKNWNDIVPTLATNIGKDINFLVERDGEEISLNLTSSGLTMENIQRLQLYQLYPAIIGEVLPGTPAEKAALQRGDRILEIKGNKIEDWYDMTRIVRENPEVPLQIKIERENTVLDFTIAPQEQMEKDENGKLVSVGKIGIAPFIYYEWHTVSFGSAIVKGFEKTISFLYMNIRGFAMLFTGEVSARQALGGPIIIGKMAGDIAKTGFLNLLEFTALLSAILAFINILPIPALDGGHLVIILIEGARGKPLSVEAKVRIQQVGMAVLLVLMLFIFYNDISRLLQ
jgi:regulator of sigma E protease